MAGTEAGAELSRRGRRQASRARLSGGRARVDAAGGGLSFTVQPARVDEGAVKDAMRADDPEGRETRGRSPRSRPAGSAPARRAPSSSAPTSLLVCGEEWFDKPVDVEDARGQLKRLRGRSHTLVTAVSVARDGAEIWGDVACPELTMRPFSDAFLERYLERAGDGILACVGSYEAEGLGAQLLAEIEGDWFAVLGLPLMPLLAFLREHGLVET